MPRHGRHGGGGMRRRRQEAKKRKLKDLLRVITWKQVKWLLRMSKPELIFIIIGTICVAVSGLISLVVPNVIGRFVDTAIESTQGYTSLAKLSLYLLAFICGASLFAFVREFTLSYAGIRLTKRIRELLFVNITKQEIGFFDANKSGELLNRISADTRMLETAVTRSVGMIVKYGFTFFAGIGILFYTSWKLCLAIIGTILPIIFISMLISGLLTRHFSKARQDGLAQMSDVATEVLTNMRTVRIFAREFYHQSEYLTALKSTFIIQLKFLVVNSISNTTIELMSKMALVGVLFFGGYLVIQGELTIGTLTSFLMYIVVVGGAVDGISRVYVDIISAIAATERVHELIERTPKILCEDEGRTTETIQGHIELKDIEFAYPTRDESTILSNFSLQLEPNTVVALVGESGGGKSTITKLIQGIYKGSQGEVYFDGIPLSEINPIWMRENIGVVAQEPVLFSCSIRENIRYGKLDATDEEIEAAAESANAAKFIDEFDEKYETLCGEKGVSLSGGQKQRIAIARALLKDPPVLLLDEATSALDAESEYVVKQALDRLMIGRTTLIVAHRLSSIRHADKICVIEKGTIVEQGSHAELLAKDGSYANLIKKQLFFDDKIHEASTVGKTEPEVSPSPTTLDDEPLKESPSNVLIEENVEEDEDESATLLRSSSADMNDIL